VARELVPGNSIRAGRLSTSLIAGSADASLSVGSYQADDYLARLGTLVPPRMTRSVLHHGKRFAVDKMSG
jgi:hypothetical protein